MRAIISGVGHYVPDKILSNSDLEKMVDTNDEWITTRTGIKERRILGVITSYSIHYTKLYENGCCPDNLLILPLICCLSEAHSASYNFV